MYKNQCMINSMIQYSIEDNAEILFFISGKDTLRNFWIFNENTVLRVNCMKHKILSWKKIYFSI